LDLTGNLPDIWDNFDNLGELSLQFNEFTGPLPASFANLTGLYNLVLSFNNFDGPIPSYFADMPIVNTSNNKSTIDTNCFDIALDDVDLESALDTNFAGWDNQFNCRANVELT